MTRQELEREVVRRIVDDLRDRGATIWVSNGEEVCLAPSASWSTDQVLSAMFTVDEEILYCQLPGTSVSTFVLLVYGSDGWDVVCDHGVSLTTLIDPVVDWAEQQTTD